LTLRFPKRLELLLQKAEEGNFRLILEHSDFSKLIYRFTTVGNRLAFSLIVSSIIVGSSLIAQKTESVFLWRFHLAEMGFMIAVLMGLWLLVSIIRSGRI
ncbi:MAG TPA: 2-octaprenyl-3-methyl-6-methoxy-1,4-benzoquinol hydroxylase, partial [Firmicutes bacterium]|nr:2-octaprenyl-3-methyl-6-methoxy-1,4-benzoquinol hydroxylase [Bacillota bacterium]